MTYLFFDTETTGLPDFKAPYGDKSQPHICQLGAIITDREGGIKAEINLIAKPEGWVIPAEASAIHGITQEDALQYGVSMRSILTLVHRFIGRCELVVAHNIKFDRFMLWREVAACEMNVSDFDFNPFCTMEQSKGATCLPPTARMLAYDMKGYKAPNLMEAYRHFFNRDFEGAHNAMADVRACKEVFFALRKAQAEAA